MAAEITGSFLMRYVRRGEGKHKPTPNDAHLGLQSVEVHWGRVADLVDDDDTHGDSTQPGFVVHVLTADGESWHHFDINYVGSFEPSPAHIEAGEDLF